MEKPKEKKRQRKNSRDERIKTSVTIRNDLKDFLERYCETFGISRSLAIDDAVKLLEEKAVADGLELVELEVA